LGKTIAVPIVLWLSLAVLASIGAPEEMIKGGVMLAIAVTIVAPLTCSRILWAWIEYRWKI